MNKKRIILGSVCVILLVASIGGAFAWFYINDEVTVSYGNSIFCEAGDSLEIALVENGVVGNWAGSIDYSTGEFTTIDITGNGLNLYRPKAIDEYQQPVGFEDAISSLQNDSNCDYIELEVAFRSVTKLNVYLSHESVIAPANPEDDSNIYGDFSKDYIAGAMRVAVVDDDGLKMLWAPNSKYELIKNGDGSYDFKSGEEGDSNPENTYYYYDKDENGNFVQKEISAEAYASKQFVVDSTNATNGDTGNSPVLVSLEPENEGEYAQETIKIRIWFEGTDREAHQALAGGNVNVKLKFVGVAKEIDTTKQNEINSIVFNQNNSTFVGLKEGMVFSTDGRSWTKYNAATPNLPQMESGSCIFIKYPETDTHYETTYVKFTKN